MRRWLIRSALAICAILVFSFVTGWPRNHFGPPTWARAPIEETDDLVAMDARLTRFLKVRFPQGTQVADLKTALVGDGFQLAPPAKICDPYPAPRTTQSWCKHERALEHREMRYEWRNFPCTYHVYIDWTEHPAGKVESVSGYYGDSCL